MSVAKYDKSPENMDSSILTVAVEWTFKYLEPFMGEADVWSHEAAISQIDKNTSVGYPYNLSKEPPIKTKGDFLKLPENIELLYDHWSKLQTPEPLPVVWTNSVKEEIRLQEKVRYNKLRTFVGPPITHVYCSQRMFGHMNSQLHANSPKTWSFVGSSKYYGGWHRLYERLSKHPNAFELDCSEYDSSLNAELLSQLARIRFRMLKRDLQTDENWARVVNLYDQIINSYIVCSGGELIQKFTGNPSGSVNTIDDNTIGQIILMAYAFITIFKGESICTYTEFTANMELALCGDDNTGTISEKIFNRFNPSTISAAWTSIGITTKYGNTSARQSLLDMHFCANGFKFVDHPAFGRRVVPVPDPEKLLASMCLYSAKGSNLKWSFLRSQAIRRECFFTPLFETLSSYCNFLIKYHFHELHAIPDPKDPTDFSWEVLSTMQATDLEILALYLGEQVALQGKGLPEEIYRENFKLVTLDKIECYAP